MIEDTEHATLFMQLVILKGHAERSPTFDFHIGSTPRPIEIAFNASLRKRNFK